MTARGEISKKRKIWIAVLVVISVAILTLFIFACVGLFDYIKTTQQVEKGIIIQNFSNTDRDTIFASFDIPAGNANLLKFRYKRGFRDSVILFAVEVHNSEKDIFEEQLQDKYDKKGELDSFSDLSAYIDAKFFEDIYDEYTITDITSDDCIEQYLNKENPYCCMFALDGGEKTIYVFHTLRTSSEMIEYVNQQIRDDNYTP